MYNYIRYDNKIWQLFSKQILEGILLAQTLCNNLKGKRSINQLFQPRNSSTKKKN